MIESATVRYVVNAAITRGQPFETRHRAPSGAPYWQTQGIVVCLMTLCLPARQRVSPEIRGLKRH